jgi:hypothetical protein
VARRRGRLAVHVPESLVLCDPELIDSATQHPLAIIWPEGVVAGSPEALGEEILTRCRRPIRCRNVLPTDSSQLKALTLARAGRPLVVHGPPGTGKSQTIANLIADALGRNKRVLFVSAKMAALDVVYDRLKRLGLQRSCLEAHSTKAGKAKIVEELRQTLEAAQELPVRPPEQRLDDLLRVRGELNTYVQELHAPRSPLAITAYQAIGIIHRLSEAPIIRAPLPWTQPLAVTRAELTSALEALDDLASQAAVFDARASHPWRGLAAGDPTAPLNREALETSLRNAHDGGGKLSTEPASKD